MGCRHLVSPLLSPSMMDIGARSSRPTSSRPRGITLELTPMSFWRSQESLCTPTGQGRGATFQHRRTPPKKEIVDVLRLNGSVPPSPAYQSFLPVAQLLCMCVRILGTISASKHPSRIALTSFVTFPNDCISSYMTNIMTDNDPTINWTVKKLVKDCTTLI